MSEHDIVVREHLRIDEETGAKRVVLVDGDGNILASIPVAGTVGVLDSSDARINPSKEDGNLATAVNLLNQLANMINPTTGRWNVQSVGGGSSAASGVNIELINDTVDIIVGQSGVDGGSGSLSSKTQRVTLANNDVSLTPLNAAANSLAVMDDWDEADRAKVNPIAGQAGVQGGSGAVSASTQRFVLATDVGLPAGSSNIGDVDVVTQPARSRTVDAIAVAHQTDAIMNGLTALTPKFAKVDLASSGDLIALVSSKKLRIVSGFLTVAADTTLKFQSGGSTDLTGAMIIKSGGGFVLPYNPVGYFETASGAKLNLVIGTATQVSGSLTYLEV